jgi:hypothetical protein
LSAAHEPDADPPTVRRAVALVALYVLLIAVTVVGAVLLIDRGAREHAQPSIAGGYDLSRANACFGGAAAAPSGAPLPSTAPAQPSTPGSSFDVVQSGEFVSLSNPAGSLGGNLRLHPAKAGQAPRLTGTIDCVGGSSRQFDGVVRLGVPNEITATVGGVPIDAVLKRDPPDPGTPIAYTPSSIAGIYKLMPRSGCFGR